MNLMENQDIQKDKGNELPLATKLFEMQGKQIYLVGTAHVSHKSVEDVKTTIDLIKPDSICIELCAPRHEALTDKERWKKMNIFQVIKAGKGSLLLAQLLMASFYQKIGDKIGIQPGAEMLEGVRLAKETGANLVLADRQVEITLKRVWRGLSFWSKMKMLGHVISSCFVHDEIDDKMIENLKNANELESVMEVFAKTFPQVKKTLIDERDIYLSQKIRQAPGNKIVAVLGAGHIQGVLKQLTKETPLAPLELIPPPSIVGKLLKWTVPLIIIGLLMAGFLRGSAEQSIESIYIWAALHSLLAGLGALLALGHPLSVLTAIVVSPFTSLYPMMASGWLAGIAQAWCKQPSVEDLQRIPEEIKSVGGFWHNKATRILLVMAFTNLGSSLATLLAGIWIVSYGL